jgi:hypothetical protein
MENHQGDISYNENTINLVCVSTDEIRATNLAKLITENDLLWKGYWVRQVKDENHRILTYTRWTNNPKTLPTTIYADTMVVEVNDSEEFKQIEDYVRARGRIPQILLYSNKDLTELEKTFRHHNARWVSKGEINGEGLRGIIVSHYFELLNLIREIFDKFDTNKDGAIEKDDIKKAAFELGENITSEEFEKCLEVMDRNHDGVISFNDFVNWWKLGRQNTVLMKKMVQLQMMTSKFLKNDKLIELKKELEALKSDKSLSKFFLKMFSDGEIQNPGFKLFFHGIKGQERFEHVRTHLLQFQQTTITENSRWTDLTLNFDPTIDQEEAFNFVREVETKMMNLLEILYPNAHDTLTRLFMFEYFRFYNSNSVVIRLRNKTDSQKQIDNALNDLINLLGAITTTQEISFDFRTKHSLGEVLRGHIDLMSALFDYTLEIKSSLHRSILKVVCGGFYNHIEQLISVLLSPLSTKFECHLKMETLLESLKVDSVFFDNITDMIKGFLVFVKGFLNNGMFEKLKSIQICFNGFDIYSSLRLKVNDLFF